MEKALPLETVSFDHEKAESGDISKMSAEEYLSWVRHEAESLPLVSRVDIDRSQLSKKQSKIIHEAVLSTLKCPSNYLPNEKWERDILFAFSELRGYLFRKNETKVETRKIVVPSLKESQSWMSFCLGHADASKLMKMISQNNEIINSTNYNEILKKRKLEVSQMAGIDMIEDVIEVEPSTEKSNEIVANANDNLDDEDIEVDIEIVEPNESNNDNDNNNNDNIESSSKSWTGYENMKPTLQLLLQFDQVLTQRLLAHHINWLVLSE